jgi:hypothetical protein
MTVVTSGTPIPFDKEWCRAAAGNPRLKALQIRPADAAALAELAKSPSLALLGLGGPDLTDEWLSALAGAPGLRLLAVGAGTDTAENVHGFAAPLVTEAGLRRLSAALPKCEIRWPGGVIPAADKSVPP